MSILKICKYGDPVLKKKCKPVAELNQDIKKLAADMLETMYAAPGAGLAANQVGVPLRMCVIDVKPDGRRQPLVLINPVIKEKKGRMTDDEGCLSFPGISAMVKRFRNIKVEAVNEKGMPVVVEGSDLLARALQHELDHLDGKVFIDYLTLFKKMQIKSEIRKRKKAGTW